MGYATVPLPTIAPAVAASMPDEPPPDTLLHVDAPPPWEMGHNPASHTRSVYDFSVVSAWSTFAGSPASIDGAGFE
jgi:hypothetical protein